MRALGSGLRGKVSREKQEAAGNGELRGPISRRGAARIFSSARRRGRVISRVYATSAGVTASRPMPKTALTVERSYGESKPRQYSTEGTPHGLELLEKPDLRTFDRLGVDGAKTPAAPRWRQGSRPAMPHRCSPRNANGRPSRGN